MRDLIRLIGMKMSRKGTCDKCGIERDKTSHKKCDRWPQNYGINKGFTYVSNSRESTLVDLKAIVAAICLGEHDDTPVRFEIRIMQTRDFEQGEEIASDEGTITHPAA